MSKVTELNIKAEMTEEDLKHFFSHTHEYKVEKTKDDTFKIIYTGGSNGPMDTLIYKPTIQTLLRTLHGMSYLEGYEQKEHELTRK